MQERAEGQNSGGAQQRSMHRTGPGPSLITSQKTPGEFLVHSKNLEQEVEL
jgi:hypothetical protein